LLFFNKYINYRFKKGEWVSGEREVIGFAGEKVIYCLEENGEVERNSLQSIGIDKNGLRYFWDDESQKWIDEIVADDLSEDDRRSNAIIFADGQIDEFIDFLRIDFIKESDQNFSCHVLKIIAEIQQQVKSGELVKGLYCDIQLGPLLLKNFHILEANTYEIILLREKPAFLKTIIDLTGKGNMYFIQNILVDKKRNLFLKKPYWIPIYKLDGLINVRDCQELLYKKEDRFVLELKHLITQMVLIEGSYVNVEFPYGRVVEHLLVEEINIKKILLTNTKKRLIQSIHINLETMNVFVMYDQRKTGRNNGFSGSLSYIIKSLSIVSA
jgi:hypothetical protein